MLAEWSTAESVVRALPDGYFLRQLQAKDYDLGFLECLAQLTEVGQITRNEFIERLQYMAARNDTYFPIVLVKRSDDSEEEKVVGAGTLMVEYKFIRHCGTLGHIEDIVVDESQRGRNFGRMIINQLCHMAQKLGCYKVSLDCSRNNEQFYSKCGFEIKGSQMCIYFGKSNGAAACNNSTAASSNGNGVPSATTKGSTCGSVGGTLERADYCSSASSNGTTNAALCL